MDGSENPLVNRYPTKCQICGTKVEKGRGLVRFSPKNGRSIVEHIACLDKKREAELNAADESAKRSMEPKPSRKPEIPKIENYDGDYHGSS